MNYTDIIVSRNELQILVNMLDDLSLMYPFYPHFQLLTAVHSDGFRLKVLIGDGWRGFRSSVRCPGLMFLRG
ncbi:MAG: hypothetical protein R6U44_04185, partial [Archaeoglobaceae archaeon]